MTNLNFKYHENGWDIEEVYVPENKNFKRIFFSVNGYEQCYYCGGFLDNDYNCQNCNQTKEDELILTQEDIDRLYSTRE